MTKVCKPPVKLLALSAIAWALAACGGGNSEDNSNGNNNSGGTLTLSAANPAAHNGAINVATAQASGNESRAADGFSASPYCALTFERASHGSNTNLYYITVYFRQSDAKVLNAGVFSPGAGWVVGQNNGTTGIDGVTVNVATRTVTFTNKVLTDIATAGVTATVNGSFTFARHASVAACGA